jgi:hypothetical protein
MGAETALNFPRMDDTIQKELADPGRPLAPPSILRLLECRTRDKPTPAAVRCVSQNVPGTRSISCSRTRTAPQRTLLCTH